MHDISDPNGPSRGDRKQARRVVDDAYAAGRISAIDRSLRVEQIDAAATRGDLAMIVRDLLGDGPQAPQPSRPPAAPPTAPTPKADAAPQWPSAPSSTPAPTPPPTAAPAPPMATPTTDGTTAPASWPPKAFTPGPALGGTGSTPGTGSAPAKSGNGKTIGCIIAVVAFIFLAPCLIGIVTVGIAAFTSDGFSTSWEVGGEDEIAPVGGSYGDGYTWDDLVWGLQSDVGTTEVSTLFADPTAATVVTVEGGRLVTWTWNLGVWERGSSDSVPELPPLADVAEIGADDLETAISNVSDGSTDDGFTSITIDGYEGSTRITVLVSGDSTDGMGTFTLDELR